MCRRLGQKLTSSTYNYLIQYYFLLWISLHAFGKHSLSRMDEVNVGCYHSMHIIDKCTHKWRAADLFYRKYTVLHFRYNYHTASLSIRLDHQRVYEDENTFVSAKKRGRLECKMFNEDWWYKTLRAETVFKLTWQLKWAGNATTPWLPERWRASTLLGLWSCNDLNCMTTCS